MSLNFEDVAPFLKQPRNYDLELFKRIENFLKVELNYSKFKSRFRLFDYGSCSEIELFFDKQWNSIAFELSDDGIPHYEHAPYFNLRIYISARGPLITSRGLKEVSKGDQSQLCPSKNTRELGPNPIAEEKAQALAMLVAQKFNLIYVDMKWLEQFQLNKKDLTSDASLSLDFSEPDALNVLFSEVM